jgi:transposase-like protein
MSAPQDGVVVDILPRERRDTTSAETLLRLAIERTGVTPREVITDRHHPYGKAVAPLPDAHHIRTGRTTRGHERP